MHSKVSASKKRKRIAFRVLYFVTANWQKSEKLDRLSETKPFSGFLCGFVRITVGLIKVLSPPANLVLPVHFHHQNNHRYQVDKGDIAKSDRGSQAAAQRCPSCIVHRRLRATVAAPRGHPPSFWGVKVTGQSEKSLCPHLFAFINDHRPHSPSSFRERMLISNRGILKYFSYVFNYVFIHIVIVMFFFFFLFCLTVSKSLIC